MDCSTPGFLVLHYVPEFAQTHVIHRQSVILPFIAPFSSCPQSFPASGFFSNELALPIWRPKYGASASVLPMNIQGQFSLGLTGLISLCPTNSQEFSLAPQFESIHSSVVSLLHGPTLISVHGYWENHSFDYMDLCRQSDVSDF